MTSLATFSDSDEVGKDQVDEEEMEVEKDADADANDNSKPDQDTQETSKEEKPSKLSEKSGSDSVISNIKKDDDRDVTSSETEIAEKKVTIKVEAKSEDTGSDGDNDICSSADTTKKADTNGNKQMQEAVKDFEGKKRRENTLKSLDDRDISDQKKPRILDTKKVEHSNTSDNEEEEEEDMAAAESPKADDKEMMKMEDVEKGSKKKLKTESDDNENSMEVDEPSVVGTIKEEDESGCRGLDKKITVKQEVRNVKEEVTASKEEVGAMKEGKNGIKEELDVSSFKKQLKEEDVKDIKLVNGIKKPETIYKLSFDAEKFISNQISKMDLDQANLTKLNGMNCQLKATERKQREISKIFSDCTNLLAKFRATLEATEAIESEEKVGGNVETVEISDDDEVEFIETTFEPDLVANRPHQQSATNPSMNNASNMDSLRAALTEALNKQMPSQVNQSLHKPFSDEDRKLFDISVGSKVLAKKLNDIWYKGIVQEVSQKERSKKFKIKFDGKGTKVLGAKHVAFYENWNIPIKVGSRVVAMYRDEEANPSTSFYAGIVAEVPTNRNRHRFLIFFDDGYAQYCLPKEIHRVYEQSKNVWEDIHPDSQEFIKEYLAQYPERPMVQLQKNQVVKTEWMGEWWTAKVVEVDASLVKMYFSADKRTEWIYRGSTRLEPLFSALARAETNKLTGFKNKRQRLVAASRGNKPVVEYTRAQTVEIDDEDTHITNKVSRTQHGPDQKKRSVAKKSTTSHNSQNGTGANSWEAPWLKMQRNPKSSSASAEKKREQYQTSSISSHKQGRDMASVLQERLAAQTDGDLDEDALGERIDIDNIISPRNMLRKKLIPHECSPECVKDCDDKDFHIKFRGRNMLLVPTLCGWERQVTKVRPSAKRIVIYRGPCARRMRNLDEVDKYLLATNCNLSIDLFTFDPNLHTHTEFVPIKTFCDIKDISYGKENVPVSCVNGIDRQYPAYVEYSTKRYPAKGVHLNLDEEFLISCDCTDGCRDRTKCACIQMTIEATTASPGGHADESVGYKYRRLNEPILTGIYECSSRCKCDYRCFNKVAQNGLQLRLQVFKTEKRGWGLRCLDDIPTGGFICIYAGQLLTEQGANEDGQQYGDEYLAELDYIEVVEKHKEGYESEVVDLDDAESTSYSSLSSNSSRSSNTADQDHSDKKTTENGSEEKLGKLVLKREANKDKEWSVKIQGSSQRTADWVDSLNNEPIVIDDDEDEEEDNTQTTKSDSSAATPIPATKRGNIFTILEEKKEPTPNADELPDLEEKLPGLGLRKCTRSTTRSRFKNLPNPKDGKNPSKERIEEREQRPSTRYYFNDGQLCYVMDAKSMGNLGRFLNHSCSPNVFVQNVFVDTHDLRFPWVAFFAGQYIRAGTELTWDYNYEVGSVPGKILYCYCSSAECRGRLL
ncbi:histone-lysine N-methyltransferase eggless isoform X1 [Octopus bimaculoides]|nr:histone-lysine N-methyltransferase eggless isoform X1 [Octopus bimaculoides]|eukprot:XP_014776504.1 PREDICTED: histone-lysine N-methyltransferase eggless-like isoform X2 [Octopus bimaculoides]